MLVVAPLLALAVTIPAAAPALAALGGDDGARHAHASSAGTAGLATRKHPKSEHFQTGQHSVTSPTASPTLAPGSPSDGDRSGASTRRPFADAGIVTAVDPAACTFTFTLRRGTNHRLRGQAVTVSVTTTTVIHRDHAVATLGDVLAGDLIAVEGRRTATGFVAARVQDRGPRPAGDPTPTPAPTTTSTPGPTPTVTPTPSVTPSVTPTATSTPAVLS